MEENASGEGENLFYKLHEDEYGKDEALLGSWKSESNRNLLDKVIMAFTRGKAPDICCLKEVVEDDDMRKNEENNATEESKNSGDQSCEAQYVLPKINGLDDLSNIVSDRILAIFDPGGYKKNVTCVINMLKEMSRSTDGVAIVISSCSTAVGEDIGAEVKKRKERFTRLNCFKGVSAKQGIGRHIADDGSFYWCDWSQLKPCVENFETMSEQSNSKNSMYAVEAALDEGNKVVELEMPYSYVLQRNGKIAASMVSNQCELGKLIDNLINFEKTEARKNMWECIMRSWLPL